MRERSEVPASVPSVSSRIAPTAAPASAASGVYGELVPPWSNAGATPRAEPGAEHDSRQRTSRWRASPFFHPMNAVIATNPRAIRSTLVTVPQGTG